MWQSPSQRLKAMADSRRREVIRLTRPIHVRRVAATIKILGNEPESSSGPPAPEKEARVVLNDLSNKGMGIYLQHPLVDGQKVSISWHDPEAITVKAKVVWCQEVHASSHVISENAFSYKIGLLFTFESPEDEAAIKQYCDDVLKSYLYGKRVA